VRPRWWVGLALMLCACGSLGVTDEGVAFLEIIEPPSRTIAVGDTIQFLARTLDQSGQPVTAAIRWRTPDTTVTVDTLTGQVVGQFAGTGRVQAVTGTEGSNLEKFITSDFFTVTVTAAAASGSVGLPR